MKRLPRILTTPLLTIAVALALAPTASGQISLSTLGVPTTVNFDAFDGSGFVPAPAAGQLDSDSYRVTGMSDGDCTFASTCASGDFARGFGDPGESTGGIYAFDVDGGGTIALGVQPGGSDFTPGSITMRFENNTGQAIADFDIAYELWVNNDEERANSWNTAWSVNDFAYFGIATLDYTSTEVSDTDGFVKTDQAESVSLGALLPDGAPLYIQFISDDVSGGGSRDEFAIRNISITPFGDTPVELSSFTGTADGDEALLRWTTESEEDLNGFEVQVIKAGSYESLGFVTATGGGSSYAFRVAEVRPGVNTFRLKSINTDGSFEYSSAVQVEVALPASFQVGAAYPNPFVDATRLDFAVQRPQHVSVSAYDLVGRRVARLFDGPVDANYTNTVELRAADLPAGVYVVRIQGEHFVSNRQVTLVR